MNTENYTTFYGVWINNDELSREQILREIELSKCFYVVEMPCGFTAEFTSETFPAESMACPCGDERHWVVKYGESNS